MKRRIMDRLVKWKDKGNRKPMFIFGSRHVGKTHLIKEFGKEFFNDMIYVNCESNVFTSDLFNSDVKFDVVVRQLEMIFNKPIDKKNTLIFFDEIEKNENALKSLLNSRNDNLEYYVTASMSYSAEAASKQYALPLVDLDYITLSPLSFDEFLVNTGNEELLSEIWSSFNEKKPLSGLQHKKAFDLYYDYLVIGGFPEVVQEYLDTSSVISSIDVQKNIIESFKSYMSRENTSAIAKKIISAYESIPTQLFKKNKKFKYKLVENGGTSNLMEAPINYLIKSNIAYKCLKIEGLDSNKVSENENNFVIYMNDVGLLTNMSEFPIYFIRNREAVNEKMFDMLSENYVASSLSNNNMDLRFWKNNYDSHVDFILKSEKGLLIPVDIKSNNSIKSRSLTNYMNEFKPRYGIRLSTKNFSIKNNVINIPLYAAFCLTSKNLDSLV